MPWALLRSTVFNLCEKAASNVRLKLQSPMGGGVGVSHIGRQYRMPRLSRRRPSLVLEVSFLRQGPVLRGAYLEMCHDIHEKDFVSDNKRQGITSAR